MKAHRNAVQHTNDIYDESTGLADRNAASGVSITVRIASLPVPGVGPKAANIYDINEIEITNPFNTDANGNYVFKAINGLYDVVVDEDGAQIVEPAIDLTDGSAFNNEIARVQGELDNIPRAWDSMVSDISLIFDDAIGGKERIINTKTIEAESVTRQTELLAVNTEITTLNDVTLPALQDDLQHLGNKFPITNTDITNDSISTPKIQTNAVTAVKIIAGAISADKLAANSVSADKIIANAITADKIATNAITTDKLSSNAITSDKISTGAIIADLIGANAILASKIAAGAITADKLVTGIIIGHDAYFNGSLTSTGGTNISGALITAPATPINGGYSLTVHGSTPSHQSTARFKNDGTGAAIVAQASGVAIKCAGGLTVLFAGNNTVNIESRILAIEARLDAAGL